MDNERMNSNEIDLGDLLSVLWKRRILVLVMVFLITLSSIIITLFIPDIFQSRGFYTISNKEIQNNQSYLMTIPQYKKYSSIFLEKSFFLKYIDSSNQFNKEIPSEVRKKIRNGGEQLDKYITPRFAFSKKDRNETGNTNKDFTNFVIGVFINFKHKNPEIAQKMVYILSDFIRFSVMDERIKNFINAGWNLSKTKKNIYENNLIDNSFNMEQLFLKKKRLEQIKRRYPQAEKLQNRQVISLENGGEIYLSPVTQLVGVESSISELESTIQFKKKQVEIESFKFEFYSRARKLINHEGINGGIVFKSLVALKKDFFAIEKLKNENMKIVSNSLDNDIDSLANLFNNVFSFAPKPDLPEKKSWPHRGLIVVVSFFFAALFSIFSAFIFEWWQQKRSD